MEYQFRYLVFYRCGKRGRKLSRRTQKEDFYEVADDAAVEHVRTALWPYLKKKKTGLKVADIAAIGLWRKPSEEEPYWPVASFNDTLGRFFRGFLQ